MTPLENLTLPVVVAPMAGGPTTVTLVRQVADAGGWGFLAAANRPLDAMAADVERLRATGVPVGINLFVPDSPTTNPAALTALRERLEPVARDLDAPLGEAAWDDDGYAAKVEWLIAHPVAAVTFTFGAPESGVVERLHAVGSLVGVTVTSVDDAVVAVQRGADFLTVQGPQAGGHQSITELADEPNTVPLLDLLAAVRARVDVPLLASGGIATPADVREVLDAGATAAQIGTAFLRSSAAGSSATHRAALASEEFTETVLTRAYSGRYARGLANAFSEAFDADAPAAYPEVNRLTGPLRKAAAASGNAQWTHLWAGSGWRRTREAMPADLIDGDAGAIARWLAGQN